MTSTTDVRSGYRETLRTLSEASVHQHFDAFLDVAWDDPALAVDPDDERWILTDADVLGRHEWYQALSHDEQIRVGRYRMANVAKVGLQFEQVLIAGLMNFSFNLANSNPEFRYATHEATEECHHTQMFQEYVNRTDPSVPGASRLFKVLAPVLPLAASLVPYAFFIGVLAGEEPIDHMQKGVLRADDPAAARRPHPLLTRIMAIHVAEEARHIGFAHQYLEHRAKGLNLTQRFTMSLWFPIIMRWLCDVIMKPSKRAQREMGIPRSVIKEIYWASPQSRATLRDMFADVRMLAEKAGMMNRISRLLWRLLKIDGPSSRYRSQPASAA